MNRNYLKAISRNMAYCIYWQVECENFKRLLYQGNRVLGYALADAIPCGKYYEVKVQLF